MFDIENDRGQQVNVAEQLPGIQKELLEAKAVYIDDVVAELPEEDLRAFPIGYPEATYTQIPARDGIAHGNIKRSNRFPNCSFLTNWTSLDDMVTWEVNVLEEGDFNVTLYYTCPKGDEGSLFQLTVGENSLKGFDPPLRGMENDRTKKRGESNVKDFKPFKLGVIHLDKGPGQLTLKALEKPGQTVMDVRLLMFERK